MNADAPKAYSINGQTKSKISMLKSSVFDHSDGFALGKGCIAVVGQRVDAAAIAADKNNKHVMFKNCAPFTDCISKSNSTQTDIAKDLDVLMPVYNPIE